MNFLDTNIGSAKDNLKSPIHNWYKFTAGFSYKFVEEIINYEHLRENSNSVIFDPFAGCGTTLVSAQKAGIKAIGNESQLFMYEVIKGKLNWNIDPIIFKEILSFIHHYVEDNLPKFQIENAHPLLATLYSRQNLQTIYLIRDSLNHVKRWKYSLFFKLALSQTLHKTSVHPIAVPYITRSKTLFVANLAMDVFSKTSNQMLVDLQPYSGYKKSSKIFLHDSRKVNNNINSKSCDICITSPPYLNNLDYGEVSKVHTHFFGITESWNDITNKVRKDLVTGSTTHYNKSHFNLENYKLQEFYQNNKIICENLLMKAQTIKSVAKTRGGNKSFDVLMLYYFQDMYHVMKEIRRVLKENGKAYLILGDSAPYGIHVATTEILGEIGKKIGFKQYDIYKIRTRGTKWKSLKHRHSLELTENVLIFE